MALYYAWQYASTTMSKAGGLNASDTTGIVLAAIPATVTASKPGIVCLTWADPLDTATAEFITYTSIDAGTKELQGVTRAAEDFAAKTHDNGCTVAWVVSKSHINNPNDLLTGITEGIKVKTSIQDVNGNEVIKTPATTAAVNEITVTNSATGNAVSIASTGGDTNIGLTLSGKGTGAVTLGQATSTGVTLAADQPVLDSSSNEYIKFSKTASAVNEVTITNAATGNAPIIEATGGDTNIHLVTRAKGSAFTKKSVLDQSNTTDAYKHNAITLTGWGFILGDGSSDLSETVTWGITATSVLSVTIAFIGYKDTTDPTAITDFSAGYYAATCSAQGIGTTGFTAVVQDTNNTAIVNTRRMGYSWTAVCTLT